MNKFTQILISFLLIVLGNIAIQADISSVDRLNLTPAQSKTVNKIKEEYNTEKAYLQGQLKQSQQELNKALKNGNYTDAQLDSMDRNISSLQSQLNALEIKSWQQIKDILTPQQKAELRNKRLN